MSKKRGTGGEGTIIIGLLVFVLAILIALVILVVFLFGLLDKIDENSHAIDATSPSSYSAEAESSTTDYATADEAAQVAANETEANLPDQEAEAA